MGYSTCVRCAVMQCKTLAEVASYRHHQQQLPGHTCVFMYVSVIIYILSLYSLLEEYSCRKTLTPCYKGSCVINLKRGFGMTTFSYHSRWRHLILQLC